MGLGAFWPSGYASSRIMTTFPVHYEISGNSQNMDSRTAAPMNHRSSRLLALPAEIRTAILEYVYQGDYFENDSANQYLVRSGYNGHTILNDAYEPVFQPLLVCRQLYQDCSLLGFSNATFVAMNLHANIPRRLSILHIKQIQSIRNIAFVANDRHFAKLGDWNGRPFNIPDLNLDSLTLVLHRSSPWHYLFDHTVVVTNLLRRLRGVKQFMIVRNHARVKGSLKSWFNRLVGHMMKIDHENRYDRDPPIPEEVWWKWIFDDAAQVITFEAQPPKPMVDEETYLQSILPLMEELRISVESEEWNPDPRSRQMYY
jgi:hypothetical protein